MKLPVNYTTLLPSTRREVREEYIRRQKGKCYHCKNLLNEKPRSAVIKLPVNKSLFPPNFFHYPVHLHHDHESGMTIGAVHNYCNAVLWQYFGE